MKIRQGKGGEIKSSECLYIFDMNLKKKLSYYFLNNSFKKTHIDVKNVFEFHWLDLQFGAQADVKI